MKRFSKRKSSKVTFKTHRKHKSKNMKKGEENAMSIFSHRYYS